MALPDARWNYPTAIHFGVGRIRELPDHCAALGMRRRMNERHCIA